MNEKKIKKFYITTPIYYINDKLHIGHAYTTNFADIINRYKKLNGYKTYFLTGSDEHGEKIEKTIQKNNINKNKFINNNVKEIKKLWNLLGIKYNKFNRTTNYAHKKIVQKIFSQLFQKGDIYPGIYKGLYCDNCEEFLTNYQINQKNNNCLICKKPYKILKESTFFFKMSKYTNFLVNYFNLHLKFIIPTYIKNEMISNFIKPGLFDLSITRTSLTWGIPTLENNKHIIYVWIDALLSYISGLGYLTNNNSLFNTFWNNKNVEIIHVIGKEISRFHTIYWPIILQSLNLRQPNRILAHGWILFKNNKISKSLGNIIDPVYLINRYGCDVLRFYLSHKFSFNSDWNFDFQMYLENYNNNLVNNFGNLIWRTINMNIKYFNGKLMIIKNIENNILLIKTINCIVIYRKYMDKYYVAKAINCILNLCKFANKYIEDNKPWELKKNNLNILLLEVLSVLTYTIIVSIFLLSPILINTSQKILNYFSIKLSDLTFNNIVDYKLIFNKKIVKKNIIFQKINIIQELKIIFHELKQFKGKDIDENI